MLEQTVDGEPVALQDIEDRKKLEQHLLRSQRLESLGTLAGGIAHDLNNVLAPAMLATDILKTIDSDPRHQKPLATIQASISRGADLVKQVLSFARGYEGQRKVIHLPMVLQEIEKIANETFLKNIEVNLTWTPHLWPVLGDPTQLHQILLNISLNARDAMPQGGSLVISAKNIEIARNLHQGYHNVEYLRVDMSGKKTKLSPCDFGICINAILTPLLREREVFLKTISTCIKKGGYIIITIPSLESYLLTSIIQQQWGIDNSLFPKTKSSKEAIRKWNNICRGNVDIDNVPHKHYLKEELQLILAKHGLVAEEFQKIEYDWKTEFHKPPRWLKEPYPWDWMVVAKRV